MSESFHVCRHLKKLREAKGLSIRALSREVGITHFTLAAYEREKVVPSLENGFKLAEFFDVPVEYLVKGEKVNTNFSDPKLLELFRILDEMPAGDREVAKKYLQKLIYNRKEWGELQSEAE